jgi:glycosyltransferase involved in cell wall biosynthesis
MTPMRIAVTVDPYLPVPPKLYGGIERIVDFLVRELCKRGHRVTLIAHPESETPARLIPYGIPPHRGRAVRFRELVQLATRLWKIRKEIDVVHSFGRMASLAPILPSSRIVKIQSYQRAVPWRGVRRAMRLAGKTLSFTGCSASLFDDLPNQGGAAAGEWRAIYNGIEVDNYRPSAAVSPTAPFVFLGRLERIKGVHHAIEISRLAGRGLVIAGNRVDDSGEPNYFDREIGPHLDGVHVRYVGPVDDKQKNELLGKAYALLMPVEWEEPFGIVMAEALACGTPVLGFPRGSVPEVVKPGFNGFLANDVESLAQFAPQIPELDRLAIRVDCVSRFGRDVIVDQYESLYRDRLSAIRGD